MFRGYYGVVHNNSFIVSLQSDNLSKDYLYAVLNSDFVRKQALSLAKNSAQPDLTHDMFKSIVIPVPTKKKQIEVAAVYNFLSQKIEENTAVNDNLQQVIKSCFDFMFATRKPNGIISDILQEHPKSTIQVNDSTGILGDYPFFTSGEAINEWQSALVDGMNCYLSTGGNATIKGYYGKAAYSTDTWCVCGKGEYSFLDITRCFSSLCWCHIV